MYRRIFMAKNNTLLAVIRIRGMFGVRHEIEETLKRLNLRYTNSLILLRGSEENMGMIHKSNDFVTYGEIDKDTLSKLLAKKELKLEASAVDALLSGSKTAKELELKMPIRMHPPRRGYESTKKGFNEGGALGYRSEGINKLILRML